MNSQTPQEYNFKLFNPLNIVKSDISKPQPDDYTEITDIKDLADAIGLDDKELSWLLYIRGTGKNDYYDRSKKYTNEGFRWILHPNPILVKVQEWILINILSKFPIHRSVQSNSVSESSLAQLIKNDHPSITLLLKDLYHSIKFKRVRTLFTDDGCNQEVANVLALALTYNYPSVDHFNKLVHFNLVNQRHIVEGINTSRRIVNIICYDMDVQIQKIANHYGLTYKRDQENLVLLHPNPNFDSSKALKRIIQIIEEEGFEPHINEAVSDLQDGLTGSGGK